jgi:FlaA1/EpsC-like NDP-sugar epimerase
VGQERNAGERILRVVDWLEVALLAAMVRLFVFPKIDRVWPFLVFPVIWILRWAVEEKSEVGQKEGTIRALKMLRTHRTIIDLAIAVLAIQLFISCLVIADIEASLPKISGILYGILVFYALVRVLKSRRLIRAGIGVFIAGAGKAGQEIAQIIKSAEDDFEVVGFIDDSKDDTQESASAEKIKILGNSNQLLPIVEKYKIDQIVYTSGEKNNPVLAKKILDARLTGQLRKSCWEKKFDKNISFFIGNGGDDSYMMDEQARNRWLMIFSKNLINLEKGGIF